jgi:hypothetical protein
VLLGGQEMIADTLWPTQIEQVYHHTQISRGAGCLLIVLDCVKARKISDKLAEREE